MADCSSNISLQPAGTQDSLCDAGNYADYVDDRNQKRTGLLSERKRTICGIWAVFLTAPHSSFPGYVPEKQAGGISNCAHTGDVFPVVAKQTISQKCCIHFGDRIS